MTWSLRNFEPSDAEAVNHLALLAFEEYRAEYSDWEAFSRNIGSMASLSDSGELIVAVDEGRIVGAVVYVGPYGPKREFFEPEWPVLRMLVVAPECRGMGIGRALTEACIARARRDGARVIALHTSPIMKVALPLYLRMGFALERPAPSLFDVAYGVYVKRLQRDE
jgi:ribosomal protein S18 acetylase RimI-like enzyme